MVPSTEDVLCAKPGTLSTSVYRDPTTALEKKKKIVVFFSIVRLRPRDAKDFPVGLTAVCYKGGVGTLVGLISQLSSISHDCDGGR